MVLSKIVVYGIYWKNFMHFKVENFWNICNIKLFEFNIVLNMSVLPYSHETSMSICNVYVLSIFEVIDIYWYGDDMLATIWNMKLH